MSNPAPDGQHPADFSSNMPQNTLAWKFLRILKPWLAGSGFVFDYIGAKLCRIPWKLSWKPLPLYINNGYISSGHSLTSLIFFPFFRCFLCCCQKLQSHKQWWIISRDWVCGGGVTEVWQWLVDSKVNLNIVYSWKWAAVTSWNKHQSFYGKECVTCSCVV